MGRRPLSTRRATSYARNNSVGALGAQVAARIRTTPLNRKRGHQDQQFPCSKSPWKCGRSAHKPIRLTCNLFRGRPARTSRPLELFRCNLVFLSLKNLSFWIDRPNTLAAHTLASAQIDDCVSKQVSLHTNQTKRITRGGCALPAPCPPPPLLIQGGAKTRTNRNAHARPALFCNVQESRATASPGAMSHIYVDHGEKRPVRESPF